MESKMLLILPPHEADFNTFTKPPWGICRIPPIGLLAVGSYVHSKGYEVKIIDCRELIVRHKTNDYIQYIIKAVMESKPNIIGINILTALFPEALRIAQELKKNFPNCLIIAGGVHPSVEPELTFQQNQYIDAICIGAGEEVCLDIMEGKNNIPGLMYRDHTSNYVSRPVEMNIDKYPFPNYNLANADYYTEFTLYTIAGWGYRGLTALTSRSCPYSCKFCASDWSKPFRWHSPEYVIEMTKHLSTYDIDTIAFCDDTIAANRDRLFKICQGFIDARLFHPYSNLRWICAIRANQVTPDILGAIKEAGCFSVSIGIESGSDRMLKMVNKKSTVAINRRACAYVREAGLHLVPSFMVGIPDETEEEMNDTVTFMQDLNINLKGMGYFRPLPGSPFYREFVANGTLIKEEIDWGDLGNFSIPTKYTFCDIPKERLERIFDKALNKAYIGAWTAIHEDTLLKYPKLIKDIASRANVRVCRSDDYWSSTHITYRMFSPYALGNYILLQLYGILPYRLRRWVRAIKPKFRSVSFFRKWMAGY
jgi:radical SAM superfamily enzyme YgiQ (UPF0313 family)